MPLNLILTSNSLTGTWALTATGGLMFPSSGMYEVDFTLSVGYGTGNEAIYLIAVKNGASVTGSMCYFYPPSSTKVVTMSSSFLLSFGHGDVLTFSVTSTVGSSKSRFNIWSTISFSWCFESMSKCNSKTNSLTKSYVNFYPETSHKTKIYSENIFLRNIKKCVTDVVFEHVIPVDLLISLTISGAESRPLVAVVSMAVTIGGDRGWTAEERRNTTEGMRRNADGEMTGGIETETADVIEMIEESVIGVDELTAAVLVRCLSTDSDMVTLFPSRWR